MSSPCVLRRASFDPSSACFTWIHPPKASLCAMLGASSHPDGALEEAQPASTGATRQAIAVSSRSATRIPTLPELIFHRRFLRLEGGRHLAQRLARIEKHRRRTARALLGDPLLPHP